MPYRKIPLVKSGIYHIFTKSIAGFKIFNTKEDYERMRLVMLFYSIEKPPCKFSLFIADPKNDVDNIVTLQAKLVRLLAYCFMPTHIHLLVEQISDGGISRYTNLILKSYSKYFNIKHRRKGPLWEGRFKSVLVETDEQFLHLTRYIHLNPVSSSFVNNPKDWKFSSYAEYVCEENVEKQKICDFYKYHTMNARVYKDFVEGRIDYQRELEYIKHLVID